MGPLHGVPFVVKDLLATAGVRSTAGSRLLSDFVPRRSATAVERLSRAGAVLMGKTNCAELGLDVHTSNELFGATLNPLDERFTPGGSSGGDSAAVAAGLAPLGIGTDYGGSIRWPAQCTGLASLRPTPGVVPCTGMLPYGAPGDLPAPNSMSLLGRSVMIAPMARSVGDLWPAVVTMAGPDGIDAQAVPVELGSPEDIDAARVRCAWFANEGTYPVRPDVAATVRAAAEALAGHGAVVEERRPPGLEEAESIYAALRAADGLADHRALAAGREGELTESIRDWFEATPPATLGEFRALAVEARPAAGPRARVHGRVAAADAAGVRHPGVPRRGARLRGGGSGGAALRDPGPGPGDHNARPAVRVGVLRDLGRGPADRGSAGGAALCGP